MTPDAERRAVGKFLRRMPRVWLTRIMITWGAVIVAMCFIHNVWMFYGLRFLLGDGVVGFVAGFFLVSRVEDARWLSAEERARCVRRSPATRRPAAGPRRCRGSGSSSIPKSLC